MAPALPQIRGYRILQSIGKGGMGEVFLAEDEMLERRVALKRIAAPLAADAAARSRFLREARAMAGVEHPHVVRVYAFGEADGQPYIVMEYVPGETLAARLGRVTRLGVDEALRIAAETAQALASAWAQGIVHRDVKPANILLDRDDHVKVADFGLARPSRAEDPVLSASGLVVGTPHYISPEQAQGDATDFRSDVYSLGIVLYEMLGGRKPFAGGSPVVVMSRHLSEPLPSLREARPDAPPSVATLVEAMTAKSPAARPAYPDLLRRLASPGQAETAADTATSTMPSLPKPVQPVRSRTRVVHRWIVAAALLASLAAALVFGLGSWTARRGSFAVAVAPFYAPDPESEKEGRVIASLLEGELTRRFAEQDVDLIGVAEVGKVVRSARAARALARRLDVDVVVWGEALAFQGEVELAARLTRRDGTLLEESGDGAPLPSATANAIALRRVRARAVADKVAEIHGLSATGRR